MPPEDSEVTITFDNENLALRPLEFLWPLEKLEPSLRTAPFDDLGFELITELARVGWEVPGIDVTFRAGGHGNETYRWVSQVSGVTEAGPFSVSFWGRQRNLGPRLDQVTGLSSMTIPPGIECSFYSDGSGPSATLYLGDWKKHGKDLMKISGFSTPKESEPKRFIAYRRRGGYNLEAEVKSGKHAPSGDEPERLLVSDLIADGRKFLTGLISDLRNMPAAPGFDDITPLGDANLRRLAFEEPIPAPPDFPALYVWLDGNDARRAGKQMHGDDAADSQYALKGNGWRLASLGCSNVPERAYDGFNYASELATRDRGHMIFRADGDTLPAKVELKWLNEIYVVDAAVYDRVRDEAMKTVGARGFTDSQVNEFQSAVARTMVPAAEYDGSFEKPVYCIGRQLGFDEARLISGPVTLHETDAGVRVSVVDNVSRETIDLYSDAKTGKYQRRTGRLVARNAAAAMRGYDAPYRVASSLEEPYEEPDVSALFTR